MSGDPVCRLGQLCPECGAMPTGERSEHRWRSGAPRADGDPDGSPAPARGDR